MAEGAAAVVERIPAPGLAEVRPLLLELLTEDQRHYQRTGQDVGAVESLVGEVRPGFDGENVVLGIRDEGRLVAFCWCVFFDPGTGYEAEVAEVFVSPGHRGGGLATALLRAAVELFQERDVTFAAVWTHPSNDAAVRLYRSAGFVPTEQTVLTWLPDSR